jgi:hypothetical protein
VLELSASSETGHKCLQAGAPGRSAPGRSLLGALSTESIPHCPSRSSSDHTVHLQSSSRRAPDGFPQPRGAVPLTQGHLPLCTCVSLLRSHCDVAVGTVRTTLPRLRPTTRDPPTSATAISPAPRRLLARHGPGQARLRRARWRRSRKGRASGPLAPRGRHDPEEARAPRRRRRGRTSAYGADAVEFSATWRLFETNDASFPNMTPIQGDWTISAIRLPKDVGPEILLRERGGLLAKAPRSPRGAAEAPLARGRVEFVTRGAMLPLDARLRSS